MSGKYLSDSLRTLIDSIDRKTALKKGIDDVLLAGDLKPEIAKRLTDRTRANLNTKITTLVFSKTELTQHIKAQGRKALIKSKALGLSKDASDEQIIEAIRKAWVPGPKAKELGLQILDTNTTLELPFVSYDAARNFLTKINLTGRPTKVFEYLNGNPGVKKELLNLINQYKDQDEKLQTVNISTINGTREVLKILRDNYSTIPAVRRLLNRFSKLGYDVGHSVPVVFKTLELISNNDLLMKVLIRQGALGKGILNGLDRNKVNVVLEKFRKEMKRGGKIETFARRKFFLEKDDKGTGSTTIRVMAESSAGNQGGTPESVIFDKVADVLSALIAKEFKLASAEVYANLKGSRTPKEKLIDATVETILTGKTTISKSKKKSKGSASSKPIKVNVGKIIAEATTLKTKSTSTKRTIKSVEAGGVNLSPSSGATKQVSSSIRTTSGRFISLVNVEALIRAALQTTIVKNMQRPNLINRTGRFASSVELVNVANRNGELTAFLTYMKYPYQTFEPGFAQGGKGYDPRRLITQSVREIAVGLVKNRLRTVIV